MYKKAELFFCRKNDACLNITLNLLRGQKIWDHYLCAGDFLNFHIHLFETYRWGIYLGQVRGGNSGVVFEGLSSLKLVNFLKELEDNLLRLEN